MKKYYLSVNYRKTIINSVLGSATELEKEIDAGKFKSQGIRDLAEEGIQELRQIAALLKVEDGEED